MNKGLLAFLLMVSLLNACTPQAQEQSSTQAAVLDMEKSVDPKLLWASLVGTVLTVPGTNAAVMMDTQLLRGELVSFGSSEQGTLRLLTPNVSTRRGEREYIVLPVEVLRVSGLGGLYLVLLERSEEGFVQRDSQWVGQGVKLLRLELSDGLVSALTVDANLGRFPPTGSTKGGVRRYLLSEGKLLNR